MVTSNYPLKFYTLMSKCCTPYLIFASTMNSSQLLTLISLVVIQSFGILFSNPFLRGSLTSSSNDIGITIPTSPWPIYGANNLGLIQKQDNPLKEIRNIVSGTRIIPLRESRI